MEKHERVAESIRKMRVHNMGREFDLQLAIAEQLREDGFAFEREVKLGKGCKVDFLGEGGIAIEVKKGRPPSTPRVVQQLERYAAFDTVQAIVVVAEGKLHNTPVAVNGKPVTKVSMAKQWGLAT